MWRTGEKLKHALSCYVPLDIAHLIKMFCRKKVFAGKPWRVKDFYIRCIGLLTTCETLTEFVNLLQAVFVVAMSDCDGQNKTGKDIPSQQYQPYLFQRIKSFIPIDNKLESKSTAEENYSLEEPVEVDAFRRKY